MNTYTAEWRDVLGCPDEQEISRGLRDVPRAKQDISRAEAVYGYNTSLLLAKYGLNTHI